MSDIVYISKSHIERKEGPLRIAHLPGESAPVTFSAHGDIAEHYKVDRAKLKGTTPSSIAAIRTDLPSAHLRDQTAVTDGRRCAIRCSVRRSRHGR